MIRFVCFLLVLIFAQTVHPQIPPGYYDGAYGLVGEELKEALHEIIKGHTTYSYSAIKDILKETDEDPDNPNNVILLYTGRSQDKNTFGGGPDDWNREHVWAKSHGGFGDIPPYGTDLHHIRPADASVNSDRGNKDFASGGVQHPEATGCYFTAYTWEPRDEVKGDVARMIFYMMVRYEGTDGELDLEVVDWVNSAPEPHHGKFADLYQWHQDDPPDDFEINRNEVIYSYQSNRNPFIDHPEFLILIYDPTNDVKDSYSSSFSIYPNPANDMIYLRVPEITAIPVPVVIRDLMGNEVYYGNPGFTGSEASINVSGLSKGLYSITLTLKDRQYIEKLVIGGR
jgi:endonuclease I